MTEDERSTRSFCARKLLRKTAARLHLWASLAHTHEIERTLRYEAALCLARCRRLSGTEHDRWEQSVTRDSKKWRER